MAERLTTIALRQTFERDDPFVFSDPDKITIDRARRVLALREDPGGGFPLDAGLSARTPAFRAPKVRQWIGFAIYHRQHFDGSSPLTGLGLRLHDGTDQFWWNGSAWTKDSAHWNTEAEVVSRISSFPVTTHALGFVINLSTTEETLSPEVVEIRVAAKVRVQSFYEDILIDSLVPLIEENVRPLTDFAETAFPGGDEFDFGAFLSAAETTFDIVDLEAIYDEKLDPKHEVNLLDSYDTKTKKAALSREVNAGTLFISAIYKPPVIVWKPGVDYDVVEKVPCIIVEETISTGSSRAPLGSLDVPNNVEKTILRIESPRRKDFRCDILGYAPGAQDEARLAEALLDFFGRHEIISSAATGDGFRMQLTGEFDHRRPSEDGVDLYSCTAEFVISDVMVYAPNRTSTLPLA